jgi:hypothetical protein
MIRKIYVFGGNDCDISYNDVFVLPTTVHVPESTLVQDLLKILTLGYFSDVVFLVEGQKVPANKCILATRCEYFEKMLNAGMKEAKEGVITLPDIKLATFKGKSHFNHQAMLNYIYTDSIDLNPDLATELLIAST